MTIAQHVAAVGTAALSPAGKLWVTCFGLGLLRPAPGTWGSMPTGAVAALMMLGGLTATGGSLMGASGAIVYHAVLLTICVMFSWACVRFGQGAEATFGKKDPGSVVADETAGQAIPFMFLPGVVAAGGIGEFWKIMYVCALAFLAFRIFDIIKLWPARSLQRITGGWGILIDDLIAGVHALIAVQLVLRLLPMPV